MDHLDDIARHNQRLWTSWASEKGEYTQPWLELDRTLLDDFAHRRIDVLPRPYMYIYPSSVLEDIAGKDVLLLASGGGQQSAVFGLLGARVTSVDLTEAQLEGDRTAARHYGYDIKTVQADMRDLSVLAAGAFDLVYQAISIVFVPDVREVYRGVCRLLRPGGCYRVGHCLPATQTIDETTLGDEGYVIKGDYRTGQMDEAEGREYRHPLSDLFNGLCELGFRIEGVFEDPRHLHPLEHPEPGSEEHIMKHVLKYFAIVARKPGDEK